MEICTIIEGLSPSAEITAMEQILGPQLGMSRGPRSNAECPSREAPQDFMMARPADAHGLDPRQEGFLQEQLPWSSCHQHTLEHPLHVPRFPRKL